MAKKLHDEWNDDLKMNVMFSPFRERTLNPKSWEQKVKFWTELIIEESLQSKISIIDNRILKEKFRRKGKTPACLDTVLNEMIRSGKIKKLSEMKQGDNSGWLSWGYSKLVKEPIGWSWKLLQGQGKEENKQEEQYVILEVIKKKAADLIEIRHRLVPKDTVDIVDYDDLRHQCQDLCPSDTEFTLVLQELCDNKQAVIQEPENGVKLVKFASPEAKKPTEEINEQELHIHRIRKAHATVKKQIKKLTEDIQELGDEAVSLKKQGLMKPALHTMRKRKLAQNRVDKLIGSMDLLEDVLYRIGQAESNEMVLRALEGGSSVLKDLTGKTTAEEVANVMDNLADITQSQDELSDEVSGLFQTEQPSQDDLESELSDIIEDTSFPALPQLPMDTSDLDLEKELEEVLREGENEGGADTSGLTDLMNELGLPDVPSFSPGQGKLKPETKKQALTS